MSVRVLLSDTFDQWRMKSNEGISMTNSSGSSNTIRTNDTTNSTSNTTGSIIADGGLGTGSSVVVGEDITTFGGTDLKGTFNIDGVDIDGAVQIDGAVTVGVDGTGYDVKFFGDTSGQFLLWDESADELALVGDTKLSFHDAAGGENIVASGDGHLEINAGTTLDITVPTVDINASTTLNVDGPTQLKGAVTVGVDDTGHDVQFFGATSGQHLLWDQSEDELALVGDTKLSFHDAAGGENIVASGDGHLEINAGTTLDITAPTVDINASTALNVDGQTQLTGATTVGVDETGYDVKFFGDTASAFLLWDASADDLILSGAAALSVDSITDATNTTSGSIHTDGGVGIAKKLYVGTDLDVAGTANLDAVDIDDAVQIDATVAVGVDGTSVDVKLFGDTSSAFMLWDASADDLILSGVAALSIDTATDSSSTITGSFHTDGGAGIAKKLYVGTDLDVDGTTNLDEVDIDDTVQIDATVAVGVDNTGHDVKFFGATSGKSWLFDEDADGVVAVSDLQQTGTITVGVDNTGHDVKFFGASAGAFMLYDESADQLIVQGAAADATTSTGKLLLSTSLTNINDADVLGRIDFQAPLEAGGSVGIAVAASILAEADATFSSTVNSTDLVFLTGDTAAASEKFRIDSTGVCTFADGAIDVDIASHDGSTGLKLGGTLVTATAKDINSIPDEINLGQSAAFAIVFGLT
jgi:hypothetical protein